MIVIPNLLALSVVERSKHFSRLIAIVLTLCLCASPAFAHAKHKLRLDTSLVPLDTALQSNDLVTARYLNLPADRESFHVYRPNNHY